MERTGAKIMPNPRRRLQNRTPVLVRLEKKEVLKWPTKTTIIWEFFQRGTYIGRADGFYRILFDKKLESIYDNGVLDMSWKGSGPAYYFPVTDVFLDDVWDLYMDRELYIDGTWQSRETRQYNFYGPLSKQIAA